MRYRLLIIFFFFFSCHNVLAFSCSSLPPTSPLPPPPLSLKYLLPLPLGPPPLWPPALSFVRHLWPPERFVTSLPAAAYGDKGPQTASL